MSDLIELSPDDVRPRHKYIEASTVHDEIERLTESNTILEYRLADSHRNVDRLTAELENEIESHKMTLNRESILADRIANLESDDHEWYLQAEELESLTAECAAKDYAIKLITGIVPFDTNRFIEMLEDYDVGIAAADTTACPADPESDPGS